ncbi:tetratricopeptide repeat protein [Chondromyces crocatus]|uniref:tetratricopeptide repeat protein n=1 Tax=Chondromyces crocatus TaxID=52 RepID=UPI00067AAD73|nr:tetratricopeptide repeat protein [Chondromyces crocatus]
MRALPLVLVVSGWAALLGCAGQSQRGSPPAHHARPEARQTQPGAAETSPPTGGSPLPFHLPCETTDLVGCTEGCAEHHVEDCVTLGAMYLRGDVVSIDTERATGLFREACTENSARGCLLLGDAYHQGILQGEEEETIAYRHACEAGANLGCLAAGRAYLGGRGVGADAVLAAQLFRRICERGNAPACVELGHLYVQGEGVPRDPLRATDLYTKACKLGFDEGCLLASRSGDVLPPRE